MSTYYSIAESFKSTIPQMYEESIVDERSSANAIETLPIPFSRFDIHVNFQSIFLMRYKFQYRNARTCMNDH